MILIFITTAWLTGQFHNATFAQPESDPSNPHLVPQLAQSSRQTFKPLRSDISPTTTRIEIVRARFTSRSLAVGDTATLQISVKNAGSKASGPFEILVKRGRAVVKRVRLKGLAAGKRLTRRVRLPLRGRAGKSCYQVGLRQPSRSNLRLGRSTEACITQVARPARVKPTERAPSKAVGRRPKVKAMKALEEGVLLTVNGSSRPVTVYEGRKVTVHWQIGSVSPATGIKLFLTADQNANYCDQDVFSSDPNWGYRSGYPNGTYTLVHNSYYLERTVYVYGCIWNAGGPPDYTGTALNKVEMRYKASPDLTVSDIFLASDEVRFKVKNIADFAVKRPGRVNYHLVARAPASIPQTFEGIAALTSLARLRPGEETGEDRVTGQGVPVSSGSQLTLCINQDKKIPESNYDNNCLTRVSGQLLPDLAVTGGRLNLFKPKKKDSTLGFFVDCITNFGCEFDTSGHVGDTIDVHVRNAGNLPVAHFDVVVGYWSDGDSGGETLRKKVTKRVEPGKGTKVTFFLSRNSSRWGDQGCCGVTAMVDPDQKITEFNEGNNKKALPTVRLKAVRDHRSR